MPDRNWMTCQTPAFRLMIATSWLAPEEWKTKQDETIQAACSAGIDWNEYLRLVHRHRIPALAWAALKRVSYMEIPKNVAQSLRKASDDCRRLAMSNLFHLSKILKALQFNRIPVLVLKGPLLSQKLYGDPGLRHSKDIDLEVAAEDMQRASRCLQEIGYRMDKDYELLTPRQWKALQRYEHDLSFFCSNGGPSLELHWRHSWDLPVDSRYSWDQQPTSEWQGCCYHTMSAVDEVIYLSSHGATHLWFRAKWLGDLARIHANGKIDWKAALHQAQKTHQELPLLGVLRLLETLYGVPMPVFSENIWAQLPARLVREPLHSLIVMEDRERTDVFMWMRSRIHAILYNLQLMPYKHWRRHIEEIAYSREDFIQFPIPDFFYWAYPLLRPVFWLIRRGRPLRQHNAESVRSAQRRKAML
jgi:hypothetical protein